MADGEAAAHERVKGNGQPGGMQSGKRLAGAMAAVAFHTECGQGFHRAAVIHVLMGDEAAGHVLQPVIDTTHDLLRLHTGIQQQDASAVVQGVAVAGGAGGDD